MKIMDIFRKLIITYFQAYGDHKFILHTRQLLRVKGSNNKISQIGNLPETQNMYHPTTFQADRPSSSLYT